MLLSLRKRIVARVYFHGITAARVLITGEIIAAPSYTERRNQVESKRRLEG